MRLQWPEKAIQRHPESSMNCSSILDNWKNIDADSSAWHSQVSIGTANKTLCRNVPYLKAKIMLLLSDDQPMLPVLTVENVFRLRLACSATSKNNLGLQMTIWPSIAVMDKQRCLENHFSEPNICFNQTVNLSIN